MHAFVMIVLCEKTELQFADLQPFSKKIPDPFRNENGY